MFSSKTMSSLRSTRPRYIIAECMISGIVLALNSFPNTGPILPEFLMISAVQIVDEVENLSGLSRGKPSLRIIDRSFNVASVISNDVRSSAYRARPAENLNSCGCLPVRSLMSSLILSIEYLRVCWHPPSPDGRHQTAAATNALSVGQGVPLSSMNTRMRSTCQQNRIAGIRLTSTCTKMTECSRESGSIESAAFLSPMGPSEGGNSP